MKKLTENYVIHLMREEWNKKLERAVGEKSKKDEKPDTDLSIEFPFKGAKKVVISKGLKVKKKSGSNGSLSQGLLYTVESVDEDNKEVTLVHEKESGPVTLTISWKEFDSEFERQ